MGKSKGKSVSFEKVADEKIIKDVQSKPQLNLPQLKSKIMAIPFHNLIILVGMIQMGLFENINQVLLKGFITLIPLQLVYDYILLKNVKKVSKKTSFPLLIVSSIVVSIILALPVYIMIVLFGAPFLSYNVETGLLCLHLSMLTFNPLLILFKFDYDQFMDIFKVDKIYKSIFMNPVLSASLMTLIGTWFGVLPIPLDWDRPWQQWPITLVIGAYLGSIAGSLVSLLF